MASSPNNKWKSQTGFLLAALGAAVGLGNLWRFPYVAGENGGAAFVLVYLAAVLFIGLPLVIAELSVGRSGHAEPVSAFESIASRIPWRWAGWIGIAGGVVILIYYPVIAGWVANYFWKTVTAGGLGAGGDYAAAFDATIADPGQSLFWMLAVLAVAGVIVLGGVHKGIERTCEILMPIFLVLVLGLAAYGMSLEGAGEALTFLFSADWTALTRSETYLAAIGQAFFSLGVAMGVLVTYGGYLPERVKLPRAALIIAVGDTLVALLAGLIIFPAVFTFGLDPEQGAALVFVVLPQVFSSMPGGIWLSVAFYGLLLIAAITSIIALIEVPAAVAIRRWGMSRRAAVLTITAGAVVAGIPSALGYGVLAPASPETPVWLDRADFLASQILLPLSGLAIALTAGWAWSSAKAIEAADLPGHGLPFVWIWSLRIVLPAAILLAMAKGLGLL
jgi:NSS family neurotransmitter:Na+ symporter